MIIAIARYMSGRKYEMNYKHCVFYWVNNYLWRKLFTAQDNSKVRIARKRFVSVQQSGEIR